MIYYSDDSLMVTLKQGTKDGLNLASDTLKASVSQTFTMSYHTDKWIISG